MTQKTNLNVSPYYDDFDRSKDFYKVLYKPGYPVQSRELTTAQSIISIFSELKLVEKFSGNDFNTIGGSKSISPPVGVPRLAHPNNIRIAKNENLIFVIFLILNCKLTHNFKKSIPLLNVFYIFTE